jgi:acetoin utilization deacetylase AcuC-like enzyme
VKRALLQGNGTAAIFQQDPRVTTFDVHGAQLHSD